MLEVTSVRGYECWRLRVLEVTSVRGYNPAGASFGAFATDSKL